MVLAVIISFLVLLINLPLLIIVADDDNKPPPADLKSDKEALLAFYNALPLVGRTLSWNPDDQDDDICKWVGITCTNEKTKNGKNGKPVIIDKSKKKRVVGVALAAKLLYGPIAANSIGKLDELERLSLGSNLLYGSIPRDIFSIPTLQAIYLQNNSFCGDIPPFRTFPPKLGILDLSFNSFTGNITPTLNNFKQLMTLCLQNNSFSGYIPDLHDLEKIERLNLSHNKLDGPIPPSLQKFPVESFMGNDGLCGKPLGDCPISPAYPPLSSAPYSNKLGAIPLVLYCSSIIILLF